MRTIRTKAEVLDHFETLAADGRWAGLYDRAGNAVENHSFLIRRRRVEELLDDVLTAGAQVLDIGCGTGIMVPHVLAGNAGYCGVDLSEKMIAQAKQYFADAQADGASVEFAVGDAEHLRYPDNSFAVVLALGLIEYLDDPGRVVSEMIRVTRPGGVVIVSVPNAVCADAAACKLFSPIVTQGTRLLRRMAGQITRPTGFFHHKYLPSRLDRLYTSRGCEKSGHTYYNLEVAFYPLRRLFPMLSLRIKQSAECRPNGPLRLFATAYIGRYIKSRQGGE